MNPENLDILKAEEITENSDAEFITSVFENLDYGYQNEVTEIIGDNLNLDGIGELGIAGLTLLGVGYGLEVMFRGLKGDNK